MAKNIFNRTVKTNIIIYPTDGTGRDCYITYNNAGFWKYNLKRIKSKEKYRRNHFAAFHSLKRIPPTWNYHADGTGRDGYILYDYGGLIHRFHSPNNSNLFRNNNYDVVTNTHYRSNFLTRDEKIYQNKLHKIQNDLLKRLYYKPKRKFNFLRKENSSPNIFYKKQLMPIRNKNEIYLNKDNNTINNNNNERYGKGFNSTSKVKDTFLDEKKNCDEDYYIPKNCYSPKNSYRFQNFKKYRVKCLSNSIDDRIYSYPFNQFTYEKNKNLIKQIQ